MLALSREHELRRPAQAQRRLLCSMGRMLGLASGLSACAPADLLQVPTDGTAALLMTTLRDGVAAHAEALTIGPEERPFITVPRPPVGDDFYALDYPCPLEGLGLTPGSVALAPGGDPMPTPQQIRRYSPEQDQDLVVVPEARFLDSVRYQASPPESGCHQWTATRRTLASTGLLAAIIPDGQALLLVSQLQIFYRYSSDDRLTPLPNWGGSPAYGATRAGDGSLYLAGSEGRVERRIGDQSTELPPFPGRVASSFGRMWLSVADGPSPELYLLSDQGDLGQLREGVWTILHRSTGTATISQAAVLAVGSGEAWVSGLSELGAGEVGHLVEGIFRIVPVPLDGAPLGRVRALSRTEDGRAWMGTESGVLAEWVEGAWSLRLVQDAPVLVVAQVSGRLLIGGQHGRLNEVGPDGQICGTVVLESKDPTDTGEVLQLVPWGQSLAALTVGTGFEEAISAVTRLEPGEPLRVPTCRD